MARFEHTKIYRAATQLVKEIELRVKDFPRKVKFTMGNRMLDLALRIVELVIEANSIKGLDRIQLIDEILHIATMLKARLSLARDAHYMSNKGCAFSSEKLVNVIRQAKGWRNYHAQKMKTDQPNDMHRVSPESGAAKAVLSEQV